MLYTTSIVFVCHLVHDCILSCVMFYPTSIVVVVCHVVHD